MSSPLALPKTHRALVLLHPTSQPSVQTVPSPSPTPGSAIVRVLAAPVLSYARDIYNGTRKYPYPTPLTTGTSAIGRIAAVGPDATLLKPGQLVYIDCTIRGRDDPSAIFLSGIHEGFTAGSRVLMRGEWRHSTYAEYAKVPLENCYLLDERRLMQEGGLEYEVERLAYIASLLVPYGGLRDIDVKAGETVIVSPATGSFGGAAVKTALAMGARVIAMGRNVEALKAIAEANDRVEIVQITGDVQADAEALQKFGPVDAFFDISPPAAAKSTHLKSGIMALRQGGRVSLMGGIYEDVAIPHSVVMHQSLTLKGKWMYNRDDIAGLIRMVEVGVLSISGRGGVDIMGKFGLEEWDAAFTMAEENQGMGKMTVLVP